MEDAAEIEVVQLSAIEVEEVAVEVTEVEVGLQEVAAGHRVVEEIHGIHDTDEYRPPCSFVLFPFVYCFIRICANIDMSLFCKTFSF